MSKKIEAVTPQKPVDVKKVNQYLKLRRQVNDMLDPVLSEVNVVVDTTRPFVTVHLGDTHFAHDDADPEAVDNAVKFLRGKNGLVVTHGNIIDGVSPKFIDTNTTRIGFPLDSQVKVMKKKFTPLIDSHQLIATTGNTCHEGWAKKNATHDPLLNIVGPDTPVIYTGGQIVFTDIHHKTLAILEAYHNSGTGRTKQSPEGSVRSRSREVPIGAKYRPNILIEGHMHKLVASQDVIHDPITDKDFIMTLGCCGTAKGTKENPDRFLISKAVPPRNQPADAGQGLVTVYYSRKGRISAYPVATYDRAQRLVDALELLNSTERQGITEELEGQVDQKQPKTKVVLNKDSCRIRLPDSASKGEGEAPLYKAVDYSITTELPIKIQFIGNLRIGSRSFQRDILTNILSDINNNPDSFYVATRRLVNTDVPHRDDRQYILEDLIGVLGIAPDSLLAVMLTDTLRENAWSRDIKGDDEDCIPALLPGDFIYNRFQQKYKQIVPVIFQEAVVNINVGKGKQKIPYVFYLKDGASHMTSMINPFHGLTRVSEIYGVNADVYVGGHTETIGWRTWMRPSGQQEIIVPGGFSEYIEKGVKNRVDYPTGGQGCIIFPGSKLIYSFASHEDGQVFHRAFRLQAGLPQAGIDIGSITGRRRTSKR